LAAAATELPGREFLQAIIDGRLPPPPIANLFGAELVAVGDGEALFRCTPDAPTYNPIGMVHGGLHCTLLDSASMRIMTPARLKTSAGLLATLAPAARNRSLLSGERFQTTSAVPARARLKGHGLSHDTETDETCVHGCR
jgi:hypothetical protein